MVVARIADSREADLRALLATMNSEPGIADPRNPLLPFGDFDRLHFARFVILEDATTVDFAVLGLPVPKFPLQLAFLADCDGDGLAVLADLAQRAEPGLRRIFRHCEGFDAEGDLLAWLKAHDIPVGANYVNWVGRTVRQIREENALRRFLSAKVPRDPLSSRESAGERAQQVRRELIDLVKGEQQAGRLTLSETLPTPLRWRIRNLINAIGVPLVGLVLSPLLLVLAPFVIYRLRRLEKSDPEIYPHPDPEALKALRKLEDRDVTNQFSALGSLKPERFRLWLVKVVLLLIDYACRHVFNRGFLGRVRTIHFARWVFIDGKARIYFASNYDGSHEAYMDDFINKVAWGLNLVFSNGVGWPRTDWLIKRGARFEQRFKYYQRRHQIPSQVWYKAYPGLTALDLIRNARIREGLEKSEMSDAETLSWLSLL
jgi:hypothetical protein